MTGTALPAGAAVVTTMTIEATAAALGSGGWQCSEPSPPRRRPDVRAEVLPDGSMALYDPCTRVAYALNASATLVWQACDGTCATTSISDGLSAVYDAPPDVIAGDVAALLHDLTRLGLLHDRLGAGR